METAIRTIVDEVLQGHVFDIETSRPPFEVETFMSKGSDMEAVSVGYHRQICRRRKDIHRRISL